MKRVTRKVLAQVTKVIRRKFGQKAKGKDVDFNIDLEALGEGASKVKEKATVKEDPKPTKSNGNGKKAKSSKSVKPAKTAKKEKAAKVTKKPGKPGPKGEKRGHPLKGDLKPLSQRPQFNPNAVFETVQEAKGVIGAVTGHLSKTWKVKDATSVVKTLLAKKALPEMYAKWNNSASIARFVTRLGIKKGIIKVVKNPLPKE